MDGLGNVNKGNKVFQTGQVLMIKTIFDCSQVWDLSYRKDQLIRNKNSFSTPNTPPTPPSKFLRLV
jgi:hypothetical protein